MRVSQHTFKDNAWYAKKVTPGLKPETVLCFGSKQILQDTGWYSALKKIYGEATIVSASTAGEISNESASDSSIVATALEFEKSNSVPIKINIRDFKDSFEAGKVVSSKFNPKGLRFILVLSDGALVNGGDLVTGINDALQNKIPVAGGLAGDGPNFKTTLVGLNEDISEGNIVAIGFYGDKLEVGFGSKGGWSEFGPTRTITRSDKNILFEIDGANALDLYKNYLGEFAEKLPGSALLFPLALTDEQGNMVVRTILSVDQEIKSMTFAGNMPRGSKVRLMKTTFNNLADAAYGAADLSQVGKEVKGDKLSILISCVGRKLVFGSRIDEEFEAVRQSLGNESVITGFYSYGEISPFKDFLKCQLHNQTMTITTFGER